MSTKRRRESEGIDVSIVIPAFNESKRISRTLETIARYAAQSPLRMEVIVVDDGSSDDTVRVVESSFVSCRKLAPKALWRVVGLAKNRGKGAAVREGMLCALGEMVLFSDADLSTPIEELGRMVPFLRQGYDVVIGSRAVAGSRIVVRQPIYRVMMGKTFNLLVRTLTVRGIHDTQCGFKIFSRRAVVPVFSRQTIDGFGFDVEILFIASRLGFRIKELPVRWIDSRETKVRPVRDAVRMLRDLFHVRRMDMKGAYR